MALKIKFKEIEFGVGDIIRVYQKIQEGDKKRLAFFEGVVLGIKGEADRKTFTVRRVGEAGVGIERIFPLSLPSITEIKIIKKGMRGSKHAKLYYIRGKSQKEIEKIYSRHNKREKAKQVSGIESQVSRKSKVKKKVIKTVKKTSETK